MHVFKHFPLSGYEKLLRSQLKGETYIYFASFVGGYLYQGVTWSEFPDSIQRMIMVPWPETDEALLKELITLKNKNDWKFNEDFIDKHSGWGLSEVRLKLVFQWLIEGLIENLTNVHNHEVK